MRLDPSAISNGRLGIDIRQPRTIHGTAQQLADAGATLAADHAARLTGKDWHMMALAFLRGFAKHRPTFNCLDLRTESRGFIPDHPDMDKRAWGAVFRTAAKQGWIRPLGYARTADQVSHGRQQMQWSWNCE